MPSHKKKRKCKLIFSVKKYITGCLRLRVEETVDYKGPWRKLGEWWKYYLSWFLLLFYCCTVAHSCLRLCNAMDSSIPGLPVLHQHPSPRVYQNSCPLSWWWHPTISSSVVPFSSHLQSLPASWSFQMSHLIILGGQSIGVSASTSVLPMNIQKRFPLGLTGLISLKSKELSRVFSNNAV